MPIHDVGYRPWKGKTTSAGTRWWTISEAGIAGALKSRWVRRALLASWIPILYLGSGFFLFEKSMEQPDENLIRDFRDIDWQEFRNTSQLAEEMNNAAQTTQADLARQVRIRQMQQMFEFAPHSESLAEATESGQTGEIRHRVWSWMLAMFLGYPQGIMTLLIVGLIVPPLISRDVRSRAFLLYYSRPITRLEYLLGKLAIPCSILMLITFVPAIGLYFFGLMLSPDLGVIADTWDLPFRVALATMVSIIPVCLLSLLFSSMTEESRFAGFAWFAVWSLGAVVWGVINLINQIEVGNSNLGSRQIAPFSEQWSLMSIYSTIGRAQAWIFGLEPDFWQVLPSLIMLSALSVVSFFWLYRRISAPVRI